MDATGALSELGLSVPTSHDAIRRAYLRNVRAHPPERDPDGFRRVREAYELLKDSPWLWTALATSDADDDHPGEAFASAMAQIDEIALRNRADGTTPRADAAPAEPWRSADEDESERENENDDDSLADDAFEQVLDDSNDPLEQAMSSGDFEGAANFLLEALGNDVADEELGFAPWQVQDVAFRLYAQGKLSLAERLLTKLDAWIERRRPPPSSFGSVATARLALLKELRVMAGIFPTPVVKALATSIEEGRFHSASGALAKAFRADDNFEYLFSQHAPLLYQAASRHARLWHKPRLGVRLRQVIEFPIWKFVALAVVLLLAAKSPMPGEKTVRLRLDEAKNPSAPSSERAAKALLRTISSDLDESVANGDCENIPRKWPVFLVAQPPGLGEASERAIGERRAAILAKCPELEGRLR